jgi:uncharacterized tellurite resistance protein B-like protein
VLSTIQRLLGLAPPDDAPQEETGFSQEARLAAVALLQRMAAADFETREEERAALIAAVGRLLGEPAEEAARTLQSAAAHGRDVVSLFDFTRVLHSRLDPQQKVEVVELLWSIACADGEIDPQEEYLVRKVARLLHVPDAEFLAAKRRAREAAG